MNVAITICKLMRVCVFKDYILYFISRYNLWYKKKAPPLNNTECAWQSFQSMAFTITRWCKLLPAQHSHEGKNHILWSKTQYQTVEWLEESLSSSSFNSSRGLLLGHQPGPFIGVEVSSECGKREVVPKSALTGDTCVCMATNNRNKLY